MYNNDQERFKNMKTKVLLKKGEGRTINAGGLWIYDNEIKEIHGHFKNGDIVDVYAHNEYPLGRGYKLVVKKT